MSGNNLSVKITADIVDLQTKFAMARAEVMGLSTELNKLARASVAGMIDPGAQARMQQVAGDFAAAKTQAAALSSALGQASGGVLGMTSRLGEAHGSISTATREFRALFDELSSGRTRQTPGTLAIIAQRVLGLGPASLAAAAGVLGLGGGLAYLAVRAAEASNAVARFKIAADTAGNLGTTTAQFEALSAEIARSQHISDDAAKTITADLASIPGVTGPALTAAAAIMGRFVGAFGLQADKAGTEMKKLLQPEVSVTQVADDLARMGAQISAMQREAAQAAERTGDAHQVLAQKLQLINEITSQSRANQQAYDASSSASFANTLAYQGLISAGLDAQKMMMQEQVKLWNQQSEAINKNVSAFRSMPQSPDQALQAGLKIAKEENPVALQIQEAQEKVTRLTQDMAEMGATASKANVSLLQATLDEAKEKLAALQFGPVIERMREQMGQLAATWDGTQSGLLAKQIQIGQAMLAAAKGDSKAEAEIRTEVARLQVQERQAAGAEVIAAARQQIAQLGTLERQGALERLEAERDIWTQALTGDRLTASQRLEVARQLNQSISGIVREQGQEAMTIARQNVAADMAIARLRLDAAKSAIDLSAAAEKSAIDQKLENLRALTVEEFNLNNQALENELSTLKDSPKEYNAVYSEIRVLKARLVADLAALDHQAAEAAKKEN